MATTDKAAWRTRPEALVPWILLAIGIPASFVLSSVVEESVENVARLRFEREASDAKAVIEHRINFYADILYGLKALFASHGPVSRLEFHRFVQSLDLKGRYPGFDVVNYAPHVTAERKARFEESVRTDTSLDPRGYPQFAIRPPGARAEYFVIAYIEPAAGFEFAFGLDLGANPNAADPGPLVTALHSARDSGELTASGVPLRIKSRGGDYTGLAMRLAVYGSGMPLGTVEQRRAAYVGSVGAGFNVANLMAGVLDAKKAQYMHFKLYDAGSAADTAASGGAGRSWLLFDSKQAAAAASPTTGETDAAFAHVLPIRVGGRIWEAHFNARKDTVIDRVDALLPRGVLAAGLLSSALLFGMLYFLASSRSRAVEIANEMTRDLRKSEKELQASTEQLQAMSRQLVEIQESERRQLARELHDRVGQNLTALSITLDILRTQIPEPASDASRSRLDDATALVDSTTGVIENVMTELRPPMLDDYGLLPALQWYATQFSGRTGIEVKVHGDEGMERLPQATEIALFRIAQEALTNVAKHAHATHVDIGLEHTGRRFTLAISDDGVGLEAGAPSAAGRRQGLGMVTMRERSQSAGGRFEIGSAAGGGTRVVVRIPAS
jgi:signal transduction histidine kinase/CHASE1-domain containing sensor protein